jgi:hypothetical protein
LRVNKQKVQKDSPYHEIEPFGSGLLNTQSIAFKRWKGLSLSQGTYFQSLEGFSPSLDDYTKEMF